MSFYPQGRDQKFFSVDFLVSTSAFSNKEKTPYSPSTLLLWMHSAARLALYHRHLNIIQPYSCLKQQQQQQRSA